MAGEFDVMSSPDYGAFGGARFQQQQLLGNLEAMQRMGQIEKQPAELDLAKAHARLFSAEAGEKEQDLAAQQAMAAHAKEAQGAMAVGGPPTGSVSAPLLEMGNFAISKGFFKQGMGVLENGLKVLHSEAQISEAKTLQAKHALEIQQMQHDSEGSAALAAGQSQQNYDRWRMTQTAMGRDITPLPEDVAGAKPYLDQVYMSSMKAKDLVAANAKALKDAADIRLANAREIAAKAAAGVSGAKVKVLTQTYDLRAKNDGDTSAAMRDLRVARTQTEKDRAAKNAAAEEAKANAQAARDRAKFPPPNAAQIADPSKLSVGQSYSTPKGVLTWTGKGWVPMRQAPAAKPVAAANAGMAEDETDDETGE